MCAKAQGKADDPGDCRSSGPGLGLCCEAVWGVKAGELSQLSVLEGPACQAEAVGFDPDAAAEA